MSFLKEKQVQMLLVALVLVVVGVFVFCHFYLEVPSVRAEIAVPSQPEYMLEYFAADVTLVTGKCEDGRRNEWSYGRALAKAIGDMRAAARKVGHEIIVTPLITGSSECSYPVCTKQLIIQEIEPNQLGRPPG